LTVPSASPLATTFRSGLSASVCGVPSSTNCSMLLSSTRSTYSAPLPAAMSSSRPRHVRCVSAAPWPASFPAGWPCASNSSRSLPCANASVLPSARQARPAGQRGARASTRGAVAASGGFHQRTAPSWPLLTSAAPRGCQASSRMPGACSPSWRAVPPAAGTRYRRPSPPPTARWLPSGAQAMATGKSSTATVATATRRAPALLMWPGSRGIR
jgi:hypothetical protein